MKINSSKGNMLIVLLSLCFNCQTTLTGIQNNVSSKKEDKNIISQNCGRREDIAYGKIDNCGCTVPPKSVFEKNKTQLNIMNLTFGKIGSSALSYSNTPEIVKIAASETIDFQVVSYSFCRNARMYNYTTSQVAWNNSMLIFIRDKRSAEEINEYYNKHPFPESTATDSQYNAINTIVTKCYTRAVFTKTMKEINLYDMFASIAACRKVVQANTPFIKDRDLQQKASNLLGYFDEIEHLKPANLSPVWRPAPGGYPEIDSVKIKAIDVLDELAKSINSNYTIPYNLEFYFFQDRKEADAAPDRPLINK